MLNVQQHIRCMIQTTLCLRYITISSFSSTVPEGPPVTLKAEANSSTTFKVSIDQPAPDVVNGIIRGYVVFYSPVTPRASDPVPYIEQNITFDRADEIVTVGRIENLRKFEVYALSAAAFTIKGLGPRIAIPVKERTLEDGK